MVESSLFLLFSLLAYCHLGLVEVTADNAGDNSCSHYHDFHPQHADSKIAGYLLVTDGKMNGKVTVVDLYRGKSISDFELKNVSAWAYTSCSGRFAFISQYEANVTYIYDSGYSIEVEGRNFFTVKRVPGTPRRLNFRIRKPTPTHFMAHHGWMVMFHDEEGTASMINERTLEARLDAYGEPFVLTVGGPQHGVVIPLSYNTAAGTVPNPEHVKYRNGSSLPIGVKVYALPSGDVLYDGSKTACMEAHGETVASGGHATVFACSAGVLVLKQENQTYSHYTIPYPSSWPANTRSYVLYSHGEYDTIFADVWNEEDKLVGLYYSDLSDSSPHFDAVVSASSESPLLVLAKDPEGKYLSVLSEDATLHMVDLKTGKVLQHVTMALGEGVRPDPSTTTIMGYGKLYISNPAAEAVHEYDANTLSLLRTFKVKGFPSGLGLVGPLFSRYSPT